MIRLARLIPVAIVAIAPTPVHAGQATCSNPGLPVGATASSDLLPGRLTLQLTSGLLPITSEQLLTDAQGELRYDTRLVLVETRLGAELAIRSWLAAGFAMPYRIVDVDVTTRDPATGEVVMPASTAIHARTETIQGIGDPLLHVRFARETGGFRLFARAGTSIPLGGIEEDPFALGAIGQEHQHVQLGTGTFVPFVAVEAQRGISPLRMTLAAWALVHASLYENEHGYQAGHRISGGVTASSALGTRGFTFGVAAEAHGETAETWQGKVYEDESNAGRLDVLVGGSIAWRPTSRFAVVADVKVPVYSHVVGTQLDYAAVLGVGVAGTFDLKPRASWRGIDHDVVGPAGTAPDLVPVSGRITVFDLWAAWCAPCRELDDRLAALARAHPDRIAVRKLDVTDGDSAGWQRYLAPGNFDLPHVKVYGVDGTLRFERTAQPAELVRAIEELLRQGTAQVPR